MTSAVSCPTSESKVSHYGRTTSSLDLALERERLAVEREKVEQARIHAELKLKEREVEVKEQEVALRRRELDVSAWKSPLVLAILAATLAALGNTVVAFVNGSAQRRLEEARASGNLALETYKAEQQLALEKAKAEATRILEMIKIDDSEQAAHNLQFLVDTGLVAELTTVKNLELYLAKPIEQQNVRLSAAATQVGGQLFESCRTMPVSIYYTAGHRVAFSEDPNEGCVIAYDGGEVEVARCNGPNYNAKLVAGHAMSVTTKKSDELCIFYVGG